MADQTGWTLGLGYMRGQDGVMRPGLLCEHLMGDGKYTEKFSRLSIPDGFVEDKGIVIPAEMKNDVVRLGLKLFLCMPCSDEFARSPFVAN
jgi:hypothetical protein